MGQWAGWPATLFYGRGSYQTWSVGRHCSQIVWELGVRVVWKFGGCEVNIWTPTSRKGLRGIHHSLAPWGQTDPTLTTSSELPPFGHRSESFKV